MSNTQFITCTALVFFILCICASEPVSIADEYIPAEIPVEECLTWESHKEKYPSIKGLDLLESMVQECAR